MILRLALLALLLLAPPAWGVPIRAQSIDTDGLTLVMNTGDTWRAILTDSGSNIIATVTKNGVTQAQQTFGNTQQAQIEAFITAQLNLLIGARVFFQWKFCGKINGVLDVRLLTSVNAIPAGTMTCS